MRQKSNTDRAKATRRSLLKALGVGGLVGGSGSYTAVAAASDATAQLGDFESGLDGWKTNGGNELNPVTAESFDPGVTKGERALAVAVDGDPYPLIWRNVRGAPFDTAPHLSANVVASTFDDDREVVFRFRYHYGTDAGKGSKGGKQSKGGSKGGTQSNAGGRDPVGRPNVVESPPMRVQQYRTSTLYWDMSDLSASALASPGRLDLVWYPAGEEPRRSPNGRGAASSYDYRGVVVLDDISLSTTGDEGASEAIQSTFDRLEQERGLIQEFVTEDETATVETGTITFSRGPEAPYRFEFLDGGSYRFTVDGEAFEFGGGAA